MGERGFHTLPYRLLTVVSVFIVQQAISNSCNLLCVLGLKGLRQYPRMDAPMEIPRFPALG